jgi:hypothetical protein
MTINAADLDFLTPGSIFRREDGRESRFLMLTNTALPTKLQSKFPPQVVYADEVGNVFSCDIDRFLNVREFHIVDAELENRLNNLLALSPEGSGTDEDSLDLDGDDDALEVSDDDEDGGLEQSLTGMTGTDTSSGTEETGEGEFLTSEEVPISFIPNSTELPVVLTAEQLRSAVTSYQQTPSTHDNSVQHALFIRADGNITAKSLIASFSPASEGTTTTYEFEVDLGDGPVTINWDKFIGVYPCVFYGSSMFQVIFSESVSVAVAVVDEVLPASAPAAAAPVTAASAAEVAIAVTTPAPAVQAAPVVNVTAAVQSSTAQNTAVGAALQAAVAPVTAKA